MIDPVKTEVMRNRFAAIAEEATTIAYRTAYTTFVKQTHDYQVAMASVGGEFYAYPVSAGVTSGICQNIRGMVDEIGMDRLKPGDVIVSNDPFTGDGLCTHIMDIHLIRPIFRDGRIISFAWAFIHASDVGGSVPGSIDPLNYEVFQEGIRIKPTLLYREGMLNEQVWSIFESNCRIPDLIWGDLQAMLSALSTMERRAHELCEKYDTDGLLKSIDDVLAVAEQKSRAVLSTLKAGEYVFSDYIESHDGKNLFFVHCCMTVKDGELDLDFSGSEPQVKYAINYVTSTRRSHPFLCMPIVNYIQTVEPTIPTNGGIIRPIKARAPEGTIMNATFPAASGNRYIAVLRVFDVVAGCLHQALAKGLAAAGSGQSGIMSYSSVDRSTGRRHVSVIEPFIGGGGARADRDGVDGINMWVAYLRSAPVEQVEIETPLVVRRFGVVADSAGAGKHRGGAAIHIELENRGIDATVTVRSLDRFRLRPWGVSGGECGSLAHVVMNPGTAREQQIGKINVLRLKSGDVLSMTTPSGGGFGRPFERDVQSVLDDVVQGLVSEDQARAIYGVAISGRAVDESATRALRARRAETKADDFTFCDARLDFERRWPPAVSAALSSSVLKAPPSMRSYLMDAIRDELEDRAVVTIDDVARSLTNLGVTSSL